MCETLRTVGFCPSCDNYKPKVSSFPFEDSYCSASEVFHMLWWTACECKAQLLGVGVGVEEAWLGVGQWWS